MSKIKVFKNGGCERPYDLLPLSEVALAERIFYRRIIYILSVTC